MSFLDSRHPYHTIPIPTAFGPTIQWPRVPVVLGGLLSGALIVATGLGLQPIVLGLALVGAVSALVVPAIGLAVLAVMLPLREPAIAGPIGLNVVLISAVAAGCAIRFAIERPHPTIHVGIAVLIAYLLLSLLQLPWYGSIPRDQLQFAGGQFLQLASGGMLFIAATYVFARTDSQPYLALAVTGAVIASALGIVMYMNGGAVGLPVRGLFSAEGIVTRAVGPFGNPNYFGLFAALALTFVAGWIGTRGGRTRVLLVMAASILVVALVLTFSRSALVAGLAGAIWLAWSHSRKAAAALVIAGVIGVLYAYPLFIDARLALTWQDVVSGAAYEAAARSDEWRLSAAAAGGQLFLSDPLFGVGFGQYHYLSPRFLGEIPITFSHNAYVNVVAEQGLGGIALFAGLIIALWRRIRQSTHDLTAAAVSLLFAYLVGALFAEPVTSLQTSGLAWLTFAAVTGAPRQDQRRWATK